MARAARLSRERIVDEALAMARDEGVAAVTLRPLAARLGVGASALYRHVTGRDELLALMHARLVDKPPLPVHTTPWDVALRAVADAAWQNYTPYPGIAAEALAGHATTQRTPEQAAALVRILEKGGFPPGDAPRHLLAFVQWVMSFIAATEYLVPPGRRIEELPELAYGGARETFDHGVELLIDGLRSRLGEAGR